MILKTRLSWIQSLQKQQQLTTPIQTQVRTSTDQIILKTLVRDVPLHTMFIVPAFLVWS